MAIFLLFVIAILNILVHRFVIEIPIDILTTLIGIDLPFWTLCAVFALLLAWFLEDDSPDWL